MSLRAGAAKRSLTPSAPAPLFGYPNVRRVSTGVHDPILASALYLADSATPDKGVVLLSARRPGPRRGGRQRVSALARHVVRAARLRDPSHLPHSAGRRGRLDFRSVHLAMVQASVSVRCNATAHSGHYALRVRLTRSTCPIVHRNRRRNRRPKSALKAARPPSPCLRRV